MLPDLRAVVAAVVAAILLLMTAFGLTATLRVAQDKQSSPLQAVRSTLLMDAALRRELRTTASLREEPPVVAETPANDIAAVPAPVVEAAVPPPAASEQTAMLPGTAPDSPETTGSIEAAHMDAAIPAAAAPSAEPPVGGPLQEQAALTPTQAPDLKPIVVKKKPRAAVKRPHGSRQARAREAARRIAAAQARRAKATPSPPQSTSWAPNTFNNFTQ